MEPTQTIPHTSDLRPLLTPTDAAEFLQRTPAALAMMRYRGTGPAFIKTGALVRYRLAVLEQWLSDNQHTRT
jgi:hypothetical protein